MSDPSVLDESTFQQLDALGGSDLILKMIDLYLDYAPDRYQAIQQGRKDQNLDEIAKAAHSLKSSAANLGATNLQKLCHSMENIANQKNIAEFEALFPQWDSAFQAVLEELKQKKSAYLEP